MFRLPLNACRTAGIRKYGTSPSIARSLSISRALRIGMGLTVASGLGLTLSHLHADDTPDTTAKPPSLGSLVRTYAVYTMCSIPFLVDYSPSILEALTGIPIVKQIVEAFVRVTFFDQFVGGDTAKETIPLLQTLRASNTGCLFAYSVEVDESEATAGTKKANETAAHKRIVDEMIRCIDVAADFEDGIAGESSTIGRRTWVAIKATALLPDAKALIHLSKHILAHRTPLATPIAFPGLPRASDLDVLYARNPSSVDLSSEEITALRELHEDLIRICTRANERGVKIIIDAEYSWYQPALDALQLSLMRQFNKNPSTSKVQPLIYGTFQAYLRRNEQYLEQSFADAKAGGYSLGVKLVRGAYHPHETAAHGNSSLSLSSEPLPPVWSTKEETDACYNACVDKLVGRIGDDIVGKRPQQVGVLFGTHNWRSCNLILDKLVSRGLAVAESDGTVVIGDEVTERVTMGQLFGMSDALTDYLVHKTKTTSPMVIKYVPYGALSEVMPYLGRRAIENKSVLGGGAAAEERKRAWKEIRKRIFE